MWSWGDSLTSGGLSLPTYTKGPALNSSATRVSCRAASGRVCSCYHIPGRGLEALCGRRRQPLPRSTATVPRAPRPAPLPPQQLAPRPLPVPDKRPPDPLVLIPQRNGLQGARRAQSRLRERDREPVSNGGGAPAPGEGGRGPGPHSVPCPRHPKPWVSATRPDRRLLRRGKARGESFSGQRPPPAPSCPRGPHLRAANYRVHLSYSSSPWRARGRPGAAYVIHSYTYTHVRIHICSLTSLTTFCG